MGINFQYDNGTSAAQLMVEATGGGAGWLDYDGDGWCDLWLVQAGSPLPGQQNSNPSDALFRNLRGGKFTAVAPQAGVDERGYSQGIAVGDFDGDGFDDVFVTNVGPDTLYRNLGDGTFADETLAAGLENPRWTSSAAWSDLDADGDLDLYVCNYLDYDPQAPVICVDKSGRPRICHPKDVAPVPNALFLNSGSGRFEQVLHERGLDAPGSKSLGLVIADFTEDGFPDIYVANDTTANHLFVNDGQAFFTERASLNGCSANSLGQYQAGMGVAYGDYDADGRADLYVTHFTADSNTLYRALGGGLFDDVTRTSGLHAPTLRRLGFGTVMHDFNCDGHADILIANGHVDEAFQEDGELFQMPPQLFSFNGQTWIECGPAGGTYFAQSLIGRALATADYDNDGAWDVAVANQNSPALLLQNSRHDGHWLKIRLIGSDGNRHGIGATVTVIRQDKTLSQQLAAGSSYCASHQPALLFGLGSGEGNCLIRVRWPDGQTHELTDVSPDSEILIRQKTGLRVISGND